MRYSLTALSTISALFLSTQAASAQNVLGVLCRVTDLGGYTSYSDVSNCGQVIFGESPITYSLGMRIDMLLFSCPTEKTCGALSLLTPNIFAVSPLNTWALNGEERPRISHATETKIFLGDLAGVLTGNPADVILTTSQTQNLVLSYDFDGTALDDATQGVSWSSIAADGSIVAFDTFGSRVMLPGGSVQSHPQVYTHTISSGVRTHASPTWNGDFADAECLLPEISADGQHVAFYTTASNILENGADSNGLEDIYVTDLTTGICTRISYKADGTQTSATSNTPAISTTGRFVAFMSGETDITSPASPIGSQIYVIDRDSDADGIYDEPGAVTPRLASKLMSGGTANGGHDASTITISGNGRYVVFSGTFTDLVTGDSNGIADVFRYDVLLDKVERVSYAASGG